MTTVLESLNRGLHRAMAADDRVIVLGEDVLDPYGGAFRVTRGLSTAFPDRVLATPISEAGITGLASGMALRGLRPVVEIMFGDFLTLAADQLINHAAKFSWMYNEQVQAPVVLRTPMGGRRGYGPTHSQTIEKHFLGVPGLRTLAPCTLGDPGGLLFEAITTTQGPVLFVENKLLYLLPILDPSEPSDEPGEFEIETAASPAAYTLRLRGAPAPSLTIASYGYMADLARKALVELAYEHEIFAELVVVTQLSPFCLELVLTSAGRSGRLLTVEEGGLTLGWGAEVIARASETLGPRLKAARRLAARDLPIPVSGVLEDAVLPGITDIIQSAKTL